MDNNIEENFIKSLKGQVLKRGTEEFKINLNQRWNIDVVNNPLLVVLAENEDDCVKSVNYARDNNLPLSIISGGHGYKSVNIDGILLNMSRLKGVKVDAEKKELIAGAGCTLGDVDDETSKFGLAIPLGHVSHTGLSGLTLGGGIGTLSRSYGITTDSLIQVKLVNYKGEIQIVNKDTNAELLFALKSAGHNFGVAVEFTFTLHPASLVYVATYVIPHAVSLEPLVKIGEFASSDECPNELACALSITPDGTIVQLIYNGSEADGTPYFEKVNAMINLPPVMKTSLPYVQLQKIIDNKVPHGMRYFQKGPFMKVALNEEIFKTILESYEKHPSKACSILLTHLGGAVKTNENVVSSSFGHRDATYQIIFLSIITDLSLKPSIVEWTNDIHTKLKPFTFGDYSNTTDDNQPIHELFGKHTDKLIELKSKYDPTNFFKFNTNIKPIKN